MLVLSGSAQAAEIQLTTGNDSLTPNPMDDDLYTFSFAFSFTRKNLRFAAWENAFTDRTNDLRFDESYVSVARPMGFVAGLQSELEVGLVYVGKGLLGETVQNGIHQALGSSSMNLPYIEESFVRPMARFRLARSLRMLPKVSLTPRVELYGAADFKYHAVASARTTWRPIQWLSWSNEVGWREGRAEFEPLEPWVREGDWVFESSVALKDRVSLSYNYNHYGVGFNHIRLDFHWTFKGERPQVVGRRPAWNQLPS